MSDEDDEPLEYPACGHEMARERSQVLDRIRSIRKTAADVGG